MKKYLLLYCVIIVFAVSSPLKSADKGCDTVNSFIQNLSGRDLLNITVNRDFEKYFWGENKKEKLDDFIVYLSWEWNKIGVDTPIVRKIKVINCVENDSNVNAEVYLYFKYVLFFYNKIEINLKWKNIGGDFYLEAPDFSTNPLK